MRSAILFASIAVCMVLLLASASSQTGQVSIYGNILNRTGSPISATITAGSASNSTVSNGNYFLKVSSGTYSINYSTPRIWIGLSSVNVISEAKNLVNYISSIGNRTYFTLSYDNNQTVQVNSSKKPSKVTVNGSLLSEVSSLSNLASSTWFYDSAAKKVSIRTASYAMCPSLSYPSDRWQRVWYDYNTSTCLGSGPDETNVQFDNDWGTASLAYGMSDYVMFRSSRTINVPTSGTYTFTVGSDDGIRLWIDDSLLIDQWVQRPYDTDTASTYLTAGSHRFRIDYYDSWINARLTFSYTGPVDETTCYSACNAQNFGSGTCQSDATCGGSESGFMIRAGQVELDLMQPNPIWAPYFISDWRSTMQSLGINTLRVGTGGYGDAWGISLVDNPDWATNLMALLDYINPDRTGASGLKIWWQQMGAEWAGDFGIDTLSLGWDTGIPYEFRVPSLVSSIEKTGDGWYERDSSWGQQFWRKELTGAAGIAESKTYIDKLAGDNSLHYNFIADPRIFGWTWGNENYMGDGVTNDRYKPIYDWTIAMMDYTHAKGGKTIANCPIYGSIPTTGWDIWFEHTVPLFDGSIDGIKHADYMETHLYPLQEFVDNSRGGSGFVNAFRSMLQRQIDYRGNFPLDHLILGEVGIWHGYSDQGFARATFSDADVASYWTGIFQALNEVGWKNVNIFSILGYEQSQMEAFAMIVRDADGTAKPLAGTEVIAENFQGGGSSGTPIGPDGCSSGTCCCYSPTVDTCGSACTSHGYSFGACQSDSTCGGSTNGIVIRAGGFDPEAVSQPLTPWGANNPMYMSDWKSVLNDLGANTMRIGTSGRTNMLDYPDEWANNFDDILKTATGLDMNGNEISPGSSTGFKIYYQSLGSPWGGNFGIQDFQTGRPTNVDMWGNMFYEPCIVGGSWGPWNVPYSERPNWHDDSGNSYYSIYGNPGYTYDPMKKVHITVNPDVNSIDSTTKFYLDKLAGNNSLHHNFFSDPRIAAWAIGNEAIFGDKGSNGVVTLGTAGIWLDQIMNYIRSHGGMGKVIANCPIIDDDLSGAYGWDQNFVDTVQLVEGHADYIETHNYGFGSALEQAALTQYPNQAWENWKSHIKWDLQNQINNLGSFPPEKMILGEFGISHGQNSETQSTTWWTDQNVRDYYTVYFQVIEELGIKWTSPLSINTRGEASGSFGVVNPNGYGPAIKIAGYDEIAAAYSGSSGSFGTPIGPDGCQSGTCCCT